MHKEMKIFTILPPYNFTPLLPLILSLNTNCNSKILIKNIKIQVTRI